MQFAVMGANVADELRGVQLGLLNVAKRGSGLQIGVINVGGEMTGAGIGLLTIHKHGYNHVRFGSGVEDQFRLGFTFGSRYVYTPMGLTLDFGADALDAVSLYAGIGVHIPVLRQEMKVPGGGREKLDVLFVDLETGFGATFPTESQSALNYPFLRVLVGGTPTKHLSPFFELTLTTRVTWGFGIQI